MERVMTQHKTKVPGVHFARYKQRKKGDYVRLVINYDMDNTLTSESMIHDRERLTDAKFAAGLGLSTESFEAVRQQDVRARAKWFDIYYTPLMLPILHGGKPVSIERMMKIQREWLEIIKLREKAAAHPFEFAVPTLLEIKYILSQELGPIEQWVHTDSPAPLAGRRLRSAGFLPCLDGVIGMAPNCPDEVRHGPYAEAVGLVEGVIQTEYEQLPDNIRFVIELQQASAKPSPNGSMAALETCELHPDVRYVQVDDKWSKGGRVAAEMRKIHPHSYFILAECEKAEAPGPNMPPIFGRIRNYSDLIPLIRRIMADDAPPIDGSN
jgi:hypothetical protein